MCKIQRNVRKISICQPRHKGYNTKSALWWRVLIWGRKIHLEHPRSPKPLPWRSVLGDWRHHERSRVVWLSPSQSYNTHNSRCHRPYHSSLPSVPGKIRTIKILTSSPKGNDRSPESNVSRSICPKTLYSLSPTFMLHIKFDQDWPTGFRDIQVQKCEIFITQGQVTPKWVVWFGSKSNSTDLNKLCLSWLPATLMMIQSKMNKLAWRLCSHYKSMGNFLDAQGQR